MTMFQELYALATSATLTMIVSADEKTGKLTISVLPKPRKDVGEAALTKDLTLTASPEDFDAGFVQALQGYREARASLTEQAEATCEVLQAAKSVCAKMASEAVAKASKPVGTAKRGTTTTVQGPDDGENPNARETEDGRANDPAPAPGESLRLFG
ncbi:PRTRC genetic system protein E [Oxalobacteraceae bacterium GrIS 1.11]